MQKIDPGVFIFHLIESLDFNECVYPRYNVTYILYPYGDTLPNRKKKVQQSFSRLTIQTIRLFIGAFLPSRINEAFTAGKKGEIRNRCERMPTRLEKKEEKKKERKIIKIKAICHYSHLHSAMDYYNNAARPSSPSIGFYYAVATLRGCLPFYTYELAVFFLRPFLPFSFILFFTSRTCSPSVR